MKIATLEDIATVQILPLFRDKAPPSVANGNAHVLQIRDLVNNWPLDLSKLTTISANQDQLNMKLQQGDVLIPARGDFYPARHLQNDQNLLFTAGQINVVRTTREVDSGYLAWYLNQAEAQSRLQNSVSGTSIRALNKASLLKLEIKIISLKAQKKISELQKYSTERSVLMKELILVREAEINELCNSLFSGGSNAHAS